MEQQVDYQYKTVPFEHQRRVFEATRDEKAYSLFWEMGTGKSKLTIDTAAYLFLTNKIDGLLVIAPNGVHANWLDEVPTHMPDAALARSRAFAYHSSKLAQKGHMKAYEYMMKADFPILCMSYDAILTENGKKVAKKFLTTRRTMMVLDESGRIKTPSAKRTRTIVAAGKLALYRRILDGTPIANGPFDVYAPMKFLDDEFWKKFHLDSYVVFKNHYGIWKKFTNGSSGQEFETCVAFRHLDELEGILKTKSSRVMKDDVLDLPPKLYSKLTFDMTPAQEKAYAGIRDEFVTFLDTVQDQVAECNHCGGKGFLPMGDDTVEACEACGGTGIARAMVSANLAIVRLLRLQQVTCGYVPEDDGGPMHLIGKDNPRLDLLMEKLQDLPHKAIVWARFTMDIDLIMEACKRLKLEAVRYDGSTGPDERLAARKNFQSDGGPQFFVANAAAAGTGLTLHKGKAAFYYSNSFKLVERLQSEDRIHRIGQTESCNYTDLIARGTIDSKLVEALRDKRNVASMILGDQLRDWI
jgi:SNF2 family DNA or RNA helicase